MRHIAMHIPSNFSVQLRRQIHDTLVLSELGFHSSSKLVEFRFKQTEYHGEDLQRSRPAKLGHLQEQAIESRELLE